MVNRELRDRAASLIEDFLASKADNDDLADDFPRSNEDRALKAIQDRIWLYYDDVRVHYCDFPVGSPEEVLFRRCALFLRTDLEYEWGDLGHQALEHPIISVISGQILRRRAIQKAKTGGYYGVWPFSSLNDFQTAKTAFSCCEVTADSEPKINAQDKAFLLSGKALSIMQAVLFFAAAACGIWGLLGHAEYLGWAFLLSAFYLLSLGVLVLSGRIREQLTHK